MAYAVAWNEASPAGGSTSASTIDTELQDLKKSVRERMNQVLDSSTAWETDGDDPKLLDVTALAGTPVLARVYPSGSQSVLTGVTLVTAFNSETIDTATFHDNSTNNSRLTVPTAGYYRIGFHLTLSSGGSGTGQGVRIRILKNGSALLLSQREITDATTQEAYSSEILDLAAASDYYEVDILQSSGDTWTLTGGTGFATIFQIERLNGTT